MVRCICKEPKKFGLPQELMRCISIKFMLIPSRFKSVTHFAKKGDPMVLYRLLMVGGQYREQLQWDKIKQLPYSRHGLRLDSSPTGHKKS